jgi:hypothetical protein
MGGAPRTGQGLPVAETTDDGRYVVVDGRRWRATDPSIPDPLRTELVGELMAARRAVRAGEADARDRVRAAKVALGERGPRWWDPPTDADRRTRVEAAILAVARHRAPDGTTCPSDAARAVGGPDWRKHMDLTRDVARALARDGRIAITQGGEPVDPDGTWRGPVRLGTTRS